MRFSKRLLCAVSVLGFAVPSYAQSVTGLVLHNSSLTNYWNTLGGDAGFNLYVSTTNSLTGLVNSGDGLSTSINLALVPGDNTFYFFGDFNPSNPNLALEVMVNGNNTSNPTLSGTNANGAADTAVTAYSGSAMRLDLSSGTAANTLSSTFGPSTVVLTKFGYNTGAPARDLVSPFSAVANGSNDTYGTFTLRLTVASSAPEPGTFALLGLGLVAGAVARRRRSL